MMKFAILFALVAAASADLVSDLSPLSPTGRIVGGVATSIEQVPYQVSLQLHPPSSLHFCGGSIISEQWILTAAHCLVYPQFWITIRAGSTLNSGGGSASGVASVISHPGYGSNEYNIPLNDIALIRLSSPLTFDNTRAAIPLYNSGEATTVGSLAIVTGWGALREGGSGTSVLQTVTIPIISKADCSAAYSVWGGLPTDQICAAFPGGGRDACQGDSGGPLAVNGRLAGVVSWGNGCARSGWPGVYAEVAAYRPWITQNSGV